MKLFDYQEEGVKFLRSKSGAILADEMGLGKTIQTIFALDEYGLIICPTTIKEDWAEAIAENIPDANIEIFNGKKKELYKEGIKNFWIINYDILDKRLEELIALRPEKAVFDEAHYIKNGSSKRGKASAKLCQAVPTVYLLTGTPVSNRPIEYFNLLKAVKHPIANNYYSYAKRYCGAFMQQMRGRQFLNVNGATNLIELHDKTKDVILRRTKSQVLNLPPKIRSIVRAEMSKEYQAQYATAWQNYYKFFRETVTPEDFETYDDYEKKVSNILMARHMIEIGKIQQITSLAKLDRIEADLLNIIEQGNRVIVFANYKETIAQLQARLTANKINFVTIDGSVAQEDRHAVVQAFQTNDEIKVFIGNMRTCREGITLTKASIVIFIDLDWDVTKHDQAEDRAHRIGQTGTVNVYYYAIKNTIDDRIIEVLTEKRIIIEQIIEGKTDRVKKTATTGDLLKSIYKHGA